MYSNLLDRDKWICLNVYNSQNTSNYNDMSRVALVDFNLEKILFVFRQPASVQQIDKTFDYSPFKNFKLYYFTIFLL